MRFSSVIHSTGCCGCLCGCCCLRAGVLVTDASVMLSLIFDITGPGIGDCGSGGSGGGCCGGSGGGRVTGSWSNDVCT